MINDNKIIQHLLLSKDSDILLDALRNRDRFAFSDIYYDDLIIINKREGCDFKYFLRELGLFWNEESLIRERKELQTLLFECRKNRKYILKHSASEGDFREVNLNQIKRKSKKLMSKKSVTFADDDKYQNLSQPMESVNVYNTNESPNIPKFVFDDLKLNEINYSELFPRFSIETNNQKQSVHLTKVISVEDVIQFEASIPMELKEGKTNDIYVSYKRNMSSHEEKASMKLQRITELEELYSIAILFEDQTERIDFKIVIENDGLVYTDDNDGLYYTMST